MITHIVFDIDGTLIDESGILDAQTSAVAWKFGDSLKAKQAVVDAFFAANDRAVAEGGQYKNDIKQYMMWIGERLSIPVTAGEAEKLASDWSGAFQNSFKEPIVFSDSEHCLSLLRERRLTIVAASGGSTENKRTLLEQAGLAPYFSSVYGTLEIGFQKQDIRFWQSLLQILRVNPAECMVIGNQINDDVIHPKALGMKTVLVKRPELLQKNLGSQDIQADYTIESFHELHLLIR